MSRSVPTLLGIIILLLVAVLVIGIYNYLAYKGLSEGKEVVGTRIHEALTGQEPPKEILQPSPAPPSQR